MKYIHDMEIDLQREARIARFCGLVRKRGGMIGESRLRREWLAVDRLKQFSDRAMMRVIRRLFQSQVDDIVRRIRRGDIARRMGYQPQIVTKEHLFAQQLFSIGLWEALLVERFTPTIIDAISRGFQTGLDRVGGLTGISFSQTLPESATALREVLEKVKEINVTTQQGLASIINEWITTPGLDEDDLISMIQSGTAFSRNRALTVGRTTAGSSFESGQQAAFVKAGVEQKRWLTERDSRVRVKPFSHVAADGEQVSIDAVFVRTGQPMRFPLDPNGSAANVINCFVGSTLVSEPDAGIKHAFRSWYDGKVITVKTATGYQVTGTSNHPILTPNGFIKMGLLNEGDEVLTAPIDNLSTSIGNLFISFSLPHVIRTVSRSKVNFHGDKPTSDVIILETTTKSVLENNNGRVPAFVSTDKVVDIQVNSFHGYVYTLETLSGIYNAGGLVASNCRCTSLPIIKIDR